MVVTPAIVSPYGFHFLIVIDENVIKHKIMIYNTVIEKIEYVLNSLYAGVRYMCEGNKPIHEKKYKQ
jgi:hypothetical protein